MRQGDVKKRKRELISSRSQDQHDSFCCRPVEVHSSWGEPPTSVPSPCFSMCRWNSELGISELQVSFDRGHFSLCVLTLT